MTFIVDARYARLVRAAIAIALADAGRDKKRRAAGRPGSIRESLLDLEATGDVVITMDVLPDPSVADDPFPGTSDEAVVLEYQKLVDGETDVLPWERAAKPEKPTRALRVG